jgi:hypothetical protein
LWLLGRFEIGHTFTAVIALTAAGRSLPASPVVVGCSAPDRPSEIDLVVARRSAADGTDGTADKRATKERTAGNASNGRAGASAEQSARGGPVTLAVTASGEGKPETGQE